VFDLVEPTHPDEFGSDREFVDARVQYLEALLKHISPRTYAIVDVPFEGDGDLFRYWPSRCSPPAPQAWLFEKSIRLRIERSGKHDDAWKAQLKADVGWIEAFLDRTRKDVAAPQCRSVEDPPGNALRTRQGCLLPIRTAKTP